MFQPLTMANFQPMKDRFCGVLRACMRDLDARGAFLDFGAGRGDVAEFLAAMEGMTRGQAYDPAFPDSLIAASGPRDSGSYLDYQRDWAQIKGPFDVVTLFDVIEHVADVGQALTDIHACVRPGGWMFVTVPYNSREWGEDDDFYGHLRRLSARGVVSMLENRGWHVIRVLDPTFPAFWLIRRVFLVWQRWSGSGVKAWAAGPPDDMKRSLISSRRSAWSAAGRFAQWMAEELVPWKFIRLFDLYLESWLLGFELFVVCQRRDRDRVCSVCRNGLTTYRDYFQGFSRQCCSYCMSEYILPEHAQGTTTGMIGGGAVLRPSAVRRLVAALRVRRLRRLAERIEGGRILAVCRDAEDLRLALAGHSHGRLDIDFGETVPVGGASGVEPYAAVAVFHEGEHVESLAPVLASLERLVQPGGLVYLEYANGRSLLKSITGWRWFGYDPPRHRQVLDAVALADLLGLANFRLWRESQFSAEYSLYIFAQSWANVVLPFQRDAMFRWLCGQSLRWPECFAVVLSAPIMALALLFYPLHQVLAQVMRRGCVVRQWYRRARIARD